MNSLFDVEATLAQRSKFDVVVSILGICCEIDVVNSMLEKLHARNVAFLTLWHQRHCNVAYLLYNVAISPQRVQR